MIAKKVSITNCSPKPIVKPAAATSSSWPLPSLRLVIVCVSLAVTLTMSAMIIFVDVRAPSLADIFLSTMYFPLGQGLQLKARRWSNNKTECLHFFKTKDENFRRFEGLQCGHAFWQSTANLEEKDRYVKKIATNYRLFERESLASKYFDEYWHEKLKDPLPTSFYNEETKNSPKAGNEFRAFRWDPLVPLPTEISHISGASQWIHRAGSTSRHIIYIFRQGRVFARLLVQGFNNSKDPRLGVEFAGRLAGVMAELIEENEPTPLRKFLLNVQWGIRYFIRATPLLCAQKLSTALSILSHWTSQLLNCTWSSLRMSLTSQLFACWRHLIGSGLGDLHFFGVAMLLLILHKLHMVLTPYDQMDFSQVRCQSMLMSAIERARRQNLLNQDLFLQPN
ncbi:hypothetical protein pdam_00017034 [Pocillopora damicornis]|uniref:Uncharacterized protein n=1 Tax=Pocillopora damicornis TaxID=46731 RepID=A0A3M6UIE6_POCDA|nr:uncharacterized protein LOC113686865 [Pocillopora damicornis]RMX53422.1 hypothetical protein pdam_00017034 [Pocillopora damicornis]